MSNYVHTFKLPSRIRVFNKHVTNRLTRVFTHLPFGPFAILRHVGRRSGKVYETVIMVWRLGADFVIALTYGPDVDWYRNLLAGGGGTVIWHRRTYRVEKPAPIDMSAALPAFPAALRPIFRWAALKDFVLLPVSGSGSVES